MPNGWLNRTAALDHWLGVRALHRASVPSARSALAGLAHLA
jgi:hypothetical protein